MGERTRYRAGCLRESMGIFQSRSWQAGESGAINGDGMEELELALGEGQGGAGTTAPRHQGRDSHPRKGIIAASRRLLEASFLHRDHHSWHSAAQPCRVDMAHARSHGCDALPCCAEAWWGQRRRPDNCQTHYRTRIKGQGPDNIKIETKQFDRTTSARRGDDHNAASRWRRKATLESGRPANWQKGGNWMGALSRRALRMWYSPSGGLPRERPPALAGGFYRAHKCFIVHSEQLRLLGRALLSRVWQKDASRYVRTVGRGTLQALRTPYRREIAPQLIRAGRACTMCPILVLGVISIGMILPFMLA
jgi:hypothetical protein